MRPDLVVGWVQALFADNRSADGERLALQIIEKNKTFAPMYDVLYRHYLSGNRPRDAEDILKTKIANNPGDASYVLQLAGHYASAKNLSETQNTVQRILNDPKGFPDGRLQAGIFTPAWASGIRHSSNSKGDLDRLKKRKSWSIRSAWRTRLWFKARRMTLGGLWS